MIYCYLEDYPYADDDKDEYEIIGFMNSDNHSYDDTVFHILYHDSFQYIMGCILELCKLNNIEMCVLNQDNNNWSFTIKKSDLNSIKSILHNL